MDGQARRLVQAVAAAAAFALVATLAAAAEPATEEAVELITAMEIDVAYGEYLAGECMSCHAVDAADDATVPRIHGRDASELVAALLDYRSGARDNSTMGNVAGTLGDEEIASLAQYLQSVGGTAAH